MTQPSDIQKELEKLLREKFGPRINILSTTITTAEDKVDKSESYQDSEEGPPSPILAFNKTPKEVKAHLDKYVISQDEAKKTLAIAVCNHYNHLLYYTGLSKEEKQNHEYAKQNVLLIGPTGVGKTYMIRQIAKLIDVPFVRADATKYSETGYVGGNVEDMVRDLVRQADDDIQRAECGIIYIDEADKLASADSSRFKDISGRGVQLGLLKLLEDTDIELKPSNDPASQMQALMEMQTGGGKPKTKTINTKHILFILSGSFTGLSDIIAHRNSASNIGFASEKELTPQNKEALLDDLHTEDLVEYGFEPEFIGRLPVRVACHSLTTNDLFMILKTAQENITKQYQQALAAYHIEADFHDSALREIAKKAFLEKTGARSLSTILDQSLKDFFYELPSLTISRLEVDGELIRNPQKKLQNILATHQESSEPLKLAVKDFEQSFRDKNGIGLTIDPNAYSVITSKTSSNYDAVMSYLTDLLMPYEYSLSLIAHNEKLTHLNLDSDCIKDPKTTLAKWMRSSVTFDLPPTEPASNSSTE